LNENSSLLDFHHEPYISKEFEELLAKLGTLNERHENLKEQVDNLKVKI
jgi:hypothetical protein